MRSFVPHSPQGRRPHAKVHNCKQSLSLLRIVSSAAFFLHVLQDCCMLCLFWLVSPAAWDILLFCLISMIGIAFSDGKHMPMLVHKCHVGGIAIHDFLFQLVKEFVGEQGKSLAPFQCSQLFINFVQNFSADGAVHTVASSMQWFCDFTFLTSSAEPGDCCFFSCANAFFSGWKLIQWPLALICTRTLTI